MTRSKIQKVKKLNLHKLVKISFITWAVNIGLFFLGLFLVPILGTIEKWPDWCAIPFIINILVGILAFGMGVLFGIIVLFEQNGLKFWSFARPILIVGAFLLVFFLGQSGLVSGLIGEKKEPSRVTPTATPLLTPTTTPKPIIKSVNQNGTTSTNSNQVNCTGPDGKTFQTTQQKCKEFNTAWGKPPTPILPNPNEIIKCNIHPDCGGGYKEMTRASCEQMICCGVDYNGTMKFVSKDQCNRAQEDNKYNFRAESCNTMCNISTDICTNLYEVGIERSECIMDINSQNSKCLSDCYSRINQ